MQPVLSNNKIKVLWRLLAMLFLVFILGRFMVVGLAKVLFNASSSDGDEAAYLALGLDLREEGVLTDGTRPLLYPLFLTTVAAREWSYFTWAKLITLTIGAATVLVTFIIGQQLFNWEVGLLAAFLLAANKEFHLRASTVYADTLLTLLFVTAFYFLVKSFTHPRDRLLAGFFVGLAYLTKGSATLLLMAWGLVALLHYRRQIIAKKQWVVVPLVFLLTAAPLLIYNTTVFGSPFYNFATTHVMWMDRWAESQVENPANLPTIGTYLQTHTFADMINRLQAGFNRLNPVLLRTLIPGRSLEPAGLGPALLTGGLILFGWLLLFRRAYVQQTFRRHRLTIQLALIFLALYYFFSAWYGRVMVESRFLIPILGPFYLLLSAMIVWLARVDRWAAAGRAERTPSPYQWIYPSLVGVGIIWGGWWLVTTTQTDAWSLSVDPFVSDQKANMAAETVQSWLELTHPAEMGEAKVVFGPSKSLPLWKFAPRFTFERIPASVDSWATLQNYLSRAAPAYIIIDSDTARRRRQALSDYFAYNDDGVEIKQIPEGWVLTYLYDWSPHTWSIFTLPTSYTPLSANLGDQVELLGYRLELEALGGSEGKKPRTLRVTLYWRAITDLNEEYTIFVHLTAPDGFVKAQQDQQPFNGFRRTSRWRSGDIVADHYDVSLEGIQPGEYLLLTGFYHSQTGERLPLIEGPSGPSSNAVLLESVQIE